MALLCILETGPPPPHPEEAARAAASPEEAARAARPPEPDVGKLVGDLKTALAQSEERRRSAQERLDAFQADAADVERGLAERLQHFQEQLRSLKAERKRTARGMQEQRLHEELRDAEAKRDAMLHATRELEVELARGAGPLRAWSDHAAGGALAELDSLEPEGVQSALRGEVRALRVALEAVEAQREEALQTRALEREEEALREQEEAQRAEALELEAAEDRLREARARAAEGLRRRPAPDDSLAALEAARARLADAEAACRQLQESLDPLREDCGQLMALRSAAEARIAQLEKRLQVSLRSAADRALRDLWQTEHRGSAALVFVLARLCGSPRLAFMVLDSNRSGKLAMIEFDSGLRLRLCLDYEAITGMKLRALFKEFDTRRNGVLQLEDLAACHPDMWASSS
ncbi:unnamed protein product [Prorocentrum cordatum]|uniref:EF-hand domain-containing protein n=1 Tax=Prorocentrum cordatum TaxID=2364126 RepID=A0ABN9WZZ3_9DINO|nr:unnamed protein product [Polarella glacialis]